MNVVVNLVGGPLDGEVRAISTTNQPILIRGLERSAYTDEEWEHVTSEIVYDYERIPVEDDLGRFRVRAIYRNPIIPRHA